MHVDCVFPTGAAFAVDAFCVFEECSEDTKQSGGPRCDACLVWLRASGVWCVRLGIPYLVLSEWVSSGPSFFAGLYPTVHNDAHDGDYIPCSRAFLAGRLPSGPIAYAVAGAAGGSDWLPGDASAGI